MFLINEIDLQFLMIVYYFIIDYRFCYIIRHEMQYGYGQIRIHNFCKYADNGLFVFF